MGRKTQKNKITSPELLAQVNPENKEILDDFLDYKSSLLSPNTIEAYRNDIEIAFVWNLQHNQNRFFCDWTKRQIIKFQNWMLNENKNSPARVKRVKASLSSMANYVESILDEDFPNFKNHFQHVESPVNVPVREKTVFTDEQIDYLMNKLVEMDRPDKACMLALARYSGRRKAELTRFKVSDFSEDRLVCNGALYKSHPLRTKGRGTEGKMLECYVLAKQFKPYFDAWMKRREEQGIESPWLFPDPNRESGHIENTTMDSWANQFSRILNKGKAENNEDSYFYWHAMRHMVATSFARLGIPDSAIKEYFGWADISMVSVYVDLNADDQLSMYFNGDHEDGVAAPKSKGFSDL